MQEVKRVCAGQLSISRHRNYRRSYADRRFHSRIRAGGFQADRGSERKSSEYKRQLKFDIEPVERRAYVIHFPDSMIVFTLAQTRAAKIEAQHGKTKTVQRLHGVKRDFVVQRATKQRMRMANDRGMGRVLRARVEQRLQPASGPVDKK